ncbi:hypothetical protein NDU88_005926 [Pleurodeles waltl]|uniref:Integrase catalytic domain-containing protein n=1 Tax=Pleurodeles waltl TaxID=8319 RepID=A0AAV7SN05_PLEWA|nr:hypothetical protein NDU88_005926 [Pleurodeles waltl]
MKHCRITPQWPKANEEVECVTTLTKVICIAVAEAQNIKSAIYNFLQDYQLTPHSTTGVALSQLCSRQSVTESIRQYPRWTNQPTPPNHSKTRRAHNNKYASQWQHTKQHNFRVGKEVLVKDCHPGGKFSLPFEEAPWTTVGIKSTMITAQRVTKTVTRNNSQFHGMET